MNSMVYGIKVSKSGKTKTHSIYNVIVRAHSRSINVYWPVHEVNGFNHGIFHMGLFQTIPNEYIYSPSFSYIPMKKYIFFSK